MSIFAWLLNKVYPDDVKNLRELSLWAEDKINELNETMDDGLSNYYIYGQAKAYVELYEIIDRMLCDKKEGDK